MGIGCNYGNGEAAPFGYGDLCAPTRLVNLTRPSESVVLTDCREGSCYVYNPTMWTFDLDLDGDGVLDSHSGVWGNEGKMYNRGAPFRHSRGANVGFVDSHVEWVRANRWLTDLRMWDCSRIPP